MTIGASLFLIAVGAILRFAVNDSIQDVDLSTVGLILIVVVVAGLVLGLFMMNRPARGETVITRERDPRDPRL
jgi:fluoride ion exporter CrcB/FEX